MPDDETPGAEVVLHQAAAVQEYRPRLLMDPDEARAQDQALRAAMQAVLTEGTDYGTIPGTDKPSLYKPGAEKLLQWFGFGHRMERAETERDGGSRVGVTYRCTVIKAMPDGREITVAVCEGYAGYDEERFFSTAEDARAKAERKERANASRYERPVNKGKWEHITDDYRAPWNSVIKMAQKRALVGAALQATSASTLFTQDMEDAPRQDSPEASAAGVLAGIAMALIKTLPAGVRHGLDRWCRDQGWPGPSKLDATQWCAALMEAGRLSAVETVSEDAA
jgi:hypothetical protein